ncbi:MAG: 1-acyl-sn-glycerol-3-phosphate acyltransferase [Deltaproteobacteria bacterium]|nr:1-acyl-sn-glycerol-3-phosphate acyltransferase [Deltaproteobacteria bacterium]
MLSPTPEQLKLLKGFERAAFGIADAVNRRPSLKRVAQSFLKVLAQSWIHQCTKNLLRLQGLEHLAALTPDRGVFVVCNHRSFFDLYLMSTVLFRKTSWVRKLFFPVRSTFFYEGPLGVVVNGVMAAWSMYPPVLRDRARKAFNEYTVGCTADLLQEAGTVVGYHPEGTRKRVGDPYELLPAALGTGEIIHRARPIVLPVFTLGMTNDIRRQIAGNFTRKGDPITLRFGAPLELGHLTAQPASPEVYRQLADAVREALMALGREDRAWRIAQGLPDLHVPALVPPAVGPPRELETETVRRPSL